MSSPFPWHALPRVSPTHAHAAARVRRVWPGVSREAIAHALKELIPHPLSLEVRRVTASATHKLDLGARGTVVVLGDERRAVAVEIEAELALAIASTIAGGKLPRAVRGRKVDPEVAGALAGVAQWLARGFEHVSIVAIEPERLVDHLGVEALAIDVAVTLGALRTGARLAVAVPELDATPQVDAVTTLRRLGETPLSLHVVCATGIGRAEISRASVVVTSSS